jgi:glycosyltransferase involved in cell wall biosynthesis
MPDRRVSMLLRNPYTHDTRVEKEAATLTEAGHRVTVIADAGPGLPEREERDGVHVIRVDRPFARVPGLRFLAGELRRWAALVRSRPDVLHAHDSNALLPVWLAAWRLHRPFVYDAHELWLGRPPRERSTLYTLLSRTWYRAVERLAVPRAAAVLTVSAPIADALATRYHLRDVTLVENYPPAAEAAAHEVAELRELPGGEAISADAPVVLYIGGLMAGRGIEAVVDAVAQLPQVELVLLGDGPLAGELQRRAASLGVEGRVHRLGPVPSARVIAYACSADIGVAPVIPDSLNNRYSLSNKLFQYMAAGLPVVASDLPQIRAVVEGADAGAVVDFGQPEAIASAIGALLQDRDEARAAGERGRTAIQRELNWERAGARLVAAYTGVG